MITKNIPGISGKITNSIADKSIVPEPAVHLYGTYTPVGANSVQNINGKDYNPIHRVTEKSGQVHIVESINPIDIQRNKNAANGTVTNKNGTVYAIRILSSQEKNEVERSLGLAAV